MVTNKDIQALNEFLTNRGVSYMLTGTAALFYHGLLPENTEVHDIDITVFTNEETRPALQAMFKELEDLSGCKYDSEHYEQLVYTFKVGANNVKVNAFEGKWGEEPCSSMNIDGNTILIHGALAVLNAKFALRRQKDVDFYLKLTNQLTSMFLCSKK